MREFRVISYLIPLFTARYQGIWLNIDYFESCTACNFRQRLFFRLARDVSAGRDYFSTYIACKYPAETIFSTYTACKYPAETIFSTYTACKYPAEIIFSTYTACEYSAETIFSTYTTCKYPAETIFSTYTACKYPAEIILDVTSDATV